MIDTDDLKHPQLLLVKLYREAQAQVTQLLTGVVYIALLEQARDEVWRAAQHKRHVLNEEKGHETLFGGQVSTDTEQGDLVAEIEGMEETHALLRQAIADQRASLPEAPGLAEFVRSLLHAEGG